MSKLIDEIREWNTPIIGAYLLWNFTQGYSTNHPYGDSPIVILHFIANAILSSNVLCEDISGRRTNLESYVRSFTENKKSDLLASIQQRTIEKRSNTMAAIDIAVSSGLLVWDTENATLHAHNITRLKRGGRKLGKTIIDRAKQANVLGGWFSSHDIASITSYLGVVL